MLVVNIDDDYITPYTMEVVETLGKGVTWHIQIQQTFEYPLDAIHLRIE